MTDPSGPPPLPPEAVISGTSPGQAKAARWCWPLILFALFPFSWFDRGPRSVEETPVPVPNPSSLAILKMQGQVVIATFGLNPVAAKEALNGLSGLAGDDHAVAALALLECFVQPDSPRIGPLLKRFSEGVPEELFTATAAAVSEGVDEEMREDLREHLGWFADLARAPGLAPPPRAGAIRARSVFVLGAMGLISTLVTVGMMAGGVLLWFHRRRLREGKSVNAFVPNQGPTGVLLESFALYLGIMTGGALLGAYFYPPFSVFSYLAAVAIPLLWPLFRRVEGADFRAAIGFHRGKGWGKEIAAGVVGYLGVLAIASIGIALMLALTFAAGYFQEDGSSILTGSREGSNGGVPAGPEAHPIVGWMYQGSFLTKLACLALAAGFAPFFEEIFFRGALQRYFRGRFRFFASALLTGMIFAALHPQGFFAIPALASLGIGFSLLREWRDSLIAPMVAHAINNGLLLLMLWWVL
jgi:membrane protease YdiL (CAAX protease family)